MRRFRLVEPDSLAAASAVLADEPEARPIAGGTALVVLIKHGVYQPTLLVSLRRVGELGGIEPTPAGGLRIGARSTIREVELDPRVRSGYPILAEACHVVANIRIRNLATIGGNLAHADHQSDPPAALVALGATVELAGPAGERSLPVSELLIGPYETALEPGELVRSVVLPPSEPGWRGAYLKFTTRSSEDRPAAGVAAMIRSVEGRCAEARLVVGAVGPAPTRIAAAEALLRGRPLDAGLADGIGPLVAEAIEAIDDIRGSARYKRQVAGVVAERALARVGAEAVA
jgi:carbon-monoxide dehydrogenase medium subunit